MSIKSLRILSNHLAVGRPAREERTPTNEPDAAPAGFGDIASKHGQHFVFNGLSSVDVDVVEVNREQYPSMKITVQIIDGGTFGDINVVAGEIWIALDEYTDFLAQLDVCEQTRRGSAVLASMSPDEFALTFEAVDALGHFVLAYRITLSKIVHGGRRNIRVYGAFDLDSSMMAEMVSGLRELGGSIV